MNIIPNTGRWNEISSVINDNFQLIANELKHFEHLSVYSKGVHSSVTELKTAYPNPLVGSFAYVGTTKPYAIYTYTTTGWVDSGITGEPQEVDITNIPIATESSSGLMSAAHVSKMRGVEEDNFNINQKLSTLEESFDDASRSIQANKTNLSNESKERKDKDSELESLISGVADFSAEMVSSLEKELGTVSRYNLNEQTVNISQFKANGVYHFEGNKANASDLPELDGTSIDATLIVKKAEKALYQRLIICTNGEDEFVYERRGELNSATGAVIWKQWETLQTAISAINKTLADKVDRDDNAPELTAGFANNLVGRGEATEEFIGFRPSGGSTSIEDGVARIEKVKGETVVYNQIAPNIVAENYATTNASVTYTDGVATILAKGNYGRIGAKNIKFNAGHTYLLSVDAKSKNLHEFLPFNAMMCGTSHVVRVTPTSTDWKTYTRIVVAGNNDSSNFLYLGDVGTTYAEGDEVSVRKVICRDITKMFNAGNEPTTIEEFESRKPLGVSDDYNEGELISNNVRAIKSVGFNLWNGKNEYSSKEYGKVCPLALRDANVIEQVKKIYLLLKQGYDIYYSCKSTGTTQGVPIGSFSLYANNKFLPIIASNSRNKATDFTGVSYDDIAQSSLIYMYPTSLSEWSISDICIHLVHTGYRNGEYEPYESFTRSLPISEIKDKDGNTLFPNGLLSAGSVYDEVTEKKAVKRIGVVDMGSMPPIKIKDGLFRIRPQGASLYPSILTSEYNLIPRSASQTGSWFEANAPDKSIGSFGWNDGYDILIKDSKHNDANNLQQAMQGVMLYYELAEPIIVDLPKPLNLNYKVCDFGTEEAIASVPSTQLRADIIYQFNAVDRIRENSKHANEANEIVGNLQKKQLNLSVKDNGNIVLSNANGESKEFMPATPSGDPMHNIYTSLGAIWNSGADTNRTGYFGHTIVHKSGRWYLNDLGDLTSADMLEVYAQTSASRRKQMLTSAYAGATCRTNIPVWNKSFELYGNGAYPQIYFSGMAEDAASIETICIHTTAVSSGGNIVKQAPLSSIAFAFEYCKKMRKVLGYLNLKGCNTSGSVNRTFFGCTALEEVNVMNLCISLSVEDSSNLSNRSILYMIDNSIATSAITITLHADAYARAMADTSITTALTNHPNVTLASA